MYRIVLTSIFFQCHSFSMFYYKEALAAHKVEIAGAVNAPAMAKIDLYLSLKSWN